MSGTPENPEPLDSVQLMDGDGQWRSFMVVYVDDETVVCESMSRNAAFTREEFAELFGGKAGE